MFNAASFISGPAVPAGILTINGVGLGPQEFVVAQAGSGSLPFKLAGVRVWFDEEPAAIVQSGALFNEDWSLNGYENIPCVLLQSCANGSASFDMLFNRHGLPKEPARAVRRLASLVHRRRTESHVF